MTSKELIEKIESISRLIELEQLKKHIANDTLKLHVGDALLYKSDIIQAIEKREAELIQNWKESELKFKSKYQVKVSGKPLPKKDIDLTDTDEIKARIQSINNQIEKLDNVRSRDFNKRHEKYKRLIERKEKLLLKIYK